MVQLKEGWTKENFGEHLVNIHCRECNTQIGFFEDVTITNHLWIISNSSLHNTTQVNQNRECQRCGNQVAIQRIFSNVIEWNQLEIVRSKVILRHFNIQKEKIYICNTNIFWGQMFKSARLEYACI